MTETKIDKMIEVIPEFSKKLEIPDDKFLFFFTPINLEEKFLFGLSLKTGTQIFGAITFIQAFRSLIYIFTPESFIRFIASIITFLLYAIICMYIFLATFKENYSYAKVSYLLISCLFILNATIYICKSVLKIIEFITPWDGDFLKLDFLVYVFGYGAYLFIYLYFIYILYRYILQLKNPSLNQNNDIGSIPQNNEELIQINQKDD